MTSQNAFDTTGKDTNERDGKYLDDHLADDLASNGTNKARVFVFIDKTILRMQ